jgi:hypothetical protein
MAPPNLKVMGKEVSKFLRQDGCGAKGQLDPWETPRGDHVARVALLPIDLAYPIASPGSGVAWRGL